MPGVHHVELWVNEVTRSAAEWGWLLERIGFEQADSWAEGRSWRAGESYLAICSAPALHGDAHDRRLPGLNHLAFHGGTRSQVDAVMADAASHGWRPLYAERYPHAGGPDHYAGWLENSDGFKVEIVAN